MGPLVFAAQMALDPTMDSTAGFLETWLRRYDALPPIGSMAMAEISAVDCLGVLRSIEKRGSHEPATRSLGVISLVLDYAVALGH
jgi:hypothetical protein